MTEILIVLGAPLGFCLLSFGAAWLMAAWLGTAPFSRRRKRRDRK